nr:MAG TPA: hypothetical protein [Caudoviricetes sp.]
MNKNVILNGSIESNIFVMDDNKETVLAIVVFVNIRQSIFFDIMPLDCFSFHIRIPSLSIDKLHTQFLVGISLCASRDILRIAVESKLQIFRMRATLSGWVQCALFGGSNIIVKSKADNNTLFDIFHLGARKCANVCAQAAFINSYDLFAQRGGRNSRGFNMNMRWQRLFILRCQIYNLNEG